MLGNLPCPTGVPNWLTAAAQLADGLVSQSEGDPEDAILCDPRLEGLRAAELRHPAGGDSSSIGGASHVAQA
jgi:hypothetical protein